MRRVEVETITESAQKDYMIITSWHEHRELRVSGLVLLHHEARRRGHMAAGGQIQRT